MPVNSERIAVLGAGSWGATLAGLLADKGHAVSLWEFDLKAANTLASTRKLPVLPDLKLPSNVEVTSDLKAALADRPLIVSATPSQFVRSTMKAAHATGAVARNALIISVTKGLEDKTIKRMSEVIAEELGGPPQSVAVLSGPSHAEEVCRHLPTALVAAHPDPAISAKIRALFTQEYFRIYTHNDMLGVELGGTLKNVIAIGCGISDGLGLGDNSKAAIMTRGLNEIARLGVKMGGQLLTFFGLAGMGDLIVTCLSKHSRNRSFGEKIGSGKSPEQALREMTMVTEGHKTAPAAVALAQRMGVECPLTQEIYQVLYQGKNPRTSLRDLMDRETPSEWRGMDSFPGEERRVL
jgi:glycerol-3-phosphate dehydrogenase (NAD(P)+)